MELHPGSVPAITEKMCERSKEWLKSLSSKYEGDELLYAVFLHILTEQGVVICWAGQGTFGPACDRMADHEGRHSWQEA